MTTETLPGLEQLKDNDEEAPAEKVERFADPRAEVVSIISARLDHVLQPVEDPAAWANVNVVTRKDLNEVLALPLPPASIFSASVRTPAYVYVDAICPVCGIPGGITIEVTAELQAKATGRKLKLSAKAAPLPHQCGQLRILEVAPTIPVANGQVTMDEAAELLDEADAGDVDLGEGAPNAEPDPDHDEGEVLGEEYSEVAESIARDLAETEPGYADAQAEADAIHQLAVTPAKDVADLDEIPF